MKGRQQMSYRLAMQRITTYGMRLTLQCKNRIGMNNRGKSIRQTPNINDDLHLKFFHVKSK